MTDDPFDSKEFKTYADRVRRELLPKIRDSAVIMSLVPDGSGDVKFAVELGFSIMMDKPIIAVVRPGTPIPERLARVCDAFVEGNLDDPDFAERINTAISAIMGEKP